MLDRLKRAMDAGRTAVAEADSVSKPPANVPALPQPAPQAEPVPLLALLVLDETGAATPELVQRRHAAAQKAGTKALFIVGSASEADFFPKQSLLCEYIPSHEEIFRATEERADVIQLYRQHRLRLILDKWRVEHCDWTGPSAGELVARMAADKDGAARPVRFRQI